MNGGCNHSADNLSSDWLHYVRPDARLPQDWSETESDGGNSHQLGTQTLDSAVNGGLFNIPFGLSRP
jgi:hypothetical protein